MSGRIYSTLGMFQDELEILSLRLQQRSCKVDLLYVGYIVTREENGARDVESWFAQITASIAGKNHYHGKIVEREDISLVHRGGVKRQAALQNSTNETKNHVGANAGWRSFYPGWMIVFEEMLSRHQQALPRSDVVELLNVVLRMSKSDE
jgi:hypothetical protein